MINAAPLKDLFDKPIYLVGLATSGLALGNALYAAGVDFWVFDDNTETLERVAKQGWIVKQPNDMNWQDIAVLVPTAGMKPYHPLLQTAQQAGAKTLSDVDMVQLCQPLARYIGITGTNGKSTTTTLAQHVWQACSQTSSLGGNIGTPPAAGMPAFGAEGTYIIELSSYMLANTNTARFDVAVCLNITPDHLDWHSDMTHYIDAKARIFRAPADKKQIAVVGVDTPDCAALAEQLKHSDQHQLITISTKTMQPNGVSVIDGWLYHNTNKLYDCTTHPYLKGVHNFENIATVFAASTACGLDATQVLAAIHTFKGLKHRQQLVGTKNHVAFINDSKATNADATSKALACYQNIYWIVGGEPKSDELHGLDVFYNRIKHAYLIGIAAPRFAKILSGFGVPHSICGTIESATNQAFADASSNGGNILLSPACASFDQYKNFEQRGDDFIRVAQELLE